MEFTQLICEPSCKETENSWKYFKSLQSPSRVFFDKWSNITAQFLIVIWFYPHQYTLSHWSEGLFEMKSLKMSIFTSPIAYFGSKITLTSFHLFVQIWSLLAAKKHYYKTEASNCLLHTSECCHNELTSFLCALVPLLTSQCTSVCEDAHFKIVFLIYYVLIEQVFLHI